MEHVEITNDILQRIIDNFGESVVAVPKHGIRGHTKDFYDHISIVELAKELLRLRGIANK